VLWYGEAPPGWGGVVGRMKLLAPGVGWAEREGRLYWTTDNGANWKDITPPDGVVDGIFFLNSSTGWVANGNYAPGSAELRINLYSTTNAGANWSSTTTTLVLKHYGMLADYAVGGGADAVAFADPRHGWMNVVFSGQTMNSHWVFLLRTSDGGRTWNRAADAPDLSQPEMLLVSGSEGWLYGGGFDSEWGLYVTRDGGRKWQQFAQNPPGLEQCEAHGLPIFQDAKRGFLQETCVPTKPYEFRRTKVLMVSSDRGRTWKLDREVAHLPEVDVSRSQYSSATVAGSDWIFAAFSNHLVLTRIGPGARIDASTGTPESGTRYTMIGQISFATPTQGWVLADNGELRSTTDGGATWSTLKPGPQPHVIQPAGN
jgi:photosystem II stability/assembly factor-like uncharacterized protein